VQRFTDVVDRDTHDVLAHYGAVLYQAQCVERQICMSAPMLLGLSRENSNRKSLEALLDRLFSQTMGQTIQELRRKNAMPDGFATRIDNALKQRNFLAHNYFWERAAEFMTPAGKSAMRAELSDMELVFRKLDSDLHASFKAWALAQGVDESFVANLLARAEGGESFAEIEADLL
jgi:hypothetical protein